MSFHYLSCRKIFRLPEAAGVYQFLGKNGTVFYIGKSVNLKKRAKSHFKEKNFRDNLFVNQTEKIGYQATGSEIEALILEAKLIKELQPKYNIAWRDDKGYYYVAITDEKFPRILLARQSKIQKSKFKTNLIGPFVDAKAIKTVLRLLRWVFPYYTKKNHPKNLCQECHLGLCPGPNPNAKAYSQNIKNLAAVLNGKKTSLLKKLEKEMKKAATAQNFETAAKLRDQVFALKSVFSHSQILDQKTTTARFRRSPKLDGGWEKTQKELKKIFKNKKAISRIEAYDISNMQGQEATGSMVVFTKGRPDKNEYRKFKIKITGRPNDTAMIKETLERRFGHPEWKYPDIILIDGGKAQLNAAIQAAKKSGFDEEKPDFKIVSLAKKHNELFVEGNKNPLLLKDLPREIFNLILQLRDEAHRFAHTYHLKLRKRAFLHRH